MGGTPQRCDPNRARVFATTFPTEVRHRAEALRRMPPELVDAISVTRPSGDRTESDLVCLTQALAEHFGLVGTVELAPPLLTIRFSRDRRQVRR